MRNLQIYEFDTEIIIGYFIVIDAFIGFLIKLFHNPSINFKAYNNNSGIKTFKGFINRDHYICGDENWKEVAEYIMNLVNRCGGKKI